MAREAAKKPVVLPQTFDGVTSWEDWIEHFERVSVVNDWTDDATKLKWLQVRLTGRAATAYKRFPDDAKASYDASKDALKNRFEPESKKEIYIIELQTRKRRKGEDWAAFGEDVRILAEKAYPGLQVEAQETLALNHYLSQLDCAQVAFGVRQKKPATVDQAVQYTLELESYLQPSKSGKVASIEQDEVSVASAARRDNQDMVAQILERMEKLEATVKSSGRSYQTTEHEGQRMGRQGGRQGGYQGSRQGGYQGGRNPPASRGKRYSQPVVCYRCGKEGHFACGCA